MQQFPPSCLAWANAPKELKSKSCLSCSIDSLGNFEELDIPKLIDTGISLSLQKNSVSLIAFLHISAVFKLSSCEAPIITAIISSLPKRPIKSKTRKFSWKISATVFRIWVPKSCPFLSQICKKLSKSAVITESWPPVWEILAISFLKFSIKLREWADLWLHHEYLF